MAWDIPPDATIDDLREALDYLAVNVGIAIGRGYITRHGALFVEGGEVGLIKPGDEPLPKRILAAESARDVRVLAKPWWSFGTGMSIQIGDTKFTVEPDAIYQGVGFVTPRKIRRARASVREFETALEAARAA
jgi:hypothetical protein